MPIFSSTGESLGTFTIYQRHPGSPTPFHQTLIEKFTHIASIAIEKRILHDWNDEEAVHILKTCRRAIAAGGKVLVMEQVVKPSNQPDPAKWMDLNRLTLLTGRERTEVEFGELYARADPRTDGERIKRSLAGGGPLRARSLCV